MKKLHNQRRQQRRLLLEACEPWQLMTNGFGADVGGYQTSNFNEINEVAESVADFGSIELNAAARFVEVLGTQYGDDVTVTRLPSSISLAGPSTGRIQVEISSYFTDETLVFDEEDFDLIRFHGDAGSDYFENLTDVATEAIGEDGNDTLLGGSGRYTLSGGTGDDFGI